MIAIGVGCRRFCAPEPIVALVERALSLAGAEDETAILVSHERKREEAGLAEAAARLSLPLRFVTQAEAKAAESGCATRSSHSIETAGLASLSEAVALAAAGPGAILLLERIVGDGVACAIAKGGTQ